MELGSKGATRVAPSFQKEGDIMKFAVTYVMVTHLTRRRAGRSRVAVIDTFDDNYAGISSYDRGYQPKAVEKIFQNLHSDQHSEAKVIDVREIVEVSDEEKATFRIVATNIGKQLPRDGSDLWKFHASVKMMEYNAWLTPELRDKWKAMSATERKHILQEARVE